jgi:two-component system NtrC family sensor kinase
VPDKLADGLVLYGLPQGGQALGLAVPVLNSPECYNAACHYHRPEQQVLGVLDLKLSTEHLDDALHVQQSRYRLSMLLVTLILCSVVGWLAWRVVHRPVHALLDGTRRLASGDLAHRIPDQSIGEIHELAESFNAMARRLQAAQQALEEWNRTLEERVAQKTRELEKARDQLVLTEKMVSLGKLSAIVAHEINNPLAGILVTIKLLRRRLPRLLGENAGEEEARKAEEKLALVEKETARCGDVVRNLLLFSRRREISRRSEEIPPIVDRCLKLVAHQAELQQVEVSVEQDPDLPPVTCDPDEIEQACLVLIMNAIDAMPDGGELRVRMKHLAGPKMVRVEVQDTGVGIPPEIQGRIFEPFYSTKTEGQGTGLGLSVLYGVVQRHLGRVDFRSRPGEGSTFWIDLPLQPPPLPVPSSPLGDSSQREVIDS